jgi:hypothetical protein
MSLTFPAAFVFNNFADSATITVAGALALTPPTRLQNQHTSVRCRVEAASMTILVDLGASTSVDSFGLFGIGSSLFSTIATATTRVRASLTDVTGADGAVFDSGSAAGRVNTYFGNFVSLKDGVGSARYVLFNLAQTSATYLEAGFVVIGVRSQVGVNFAYGSSDIPVDPSIKTKSRSMATHVDTRNKYRKWTFNFEFLSETERAGWVESLDFTCGASRNVMMIRKVDSSDLGRDTLCGLLTETTSSVTRSGFLSTTPDAYSKAYTIEQRL